MLKGLKIISDEVVIALMIEKTMMTITKMIFRADHLEQGSFFGGGRGEDWTECPDLPLSTR